MLTIAHIRERLSEIRLVGTPVDIVQAGFVQRIGWDGSRIDVEIMLPPTSSPARQVLETDVQRALQALPGVREVRVHLLQSGKAAESDSTLVLPGVRQILAVASAKGGVGKSTVAANLALALAALGLRVGILDADVYGPSLPLLFGTRGPVRVGPDNQLVPVEKFGVQLLSVGFFIDEEAPAIWRGPVVMSLIRQFLRDVAWSDLDLLIIDLPPGTGDAPLSLVQLVPITGALIVTTPQTVALADVERGIAMFEKVRAPVLGIVENMAAYTCPHCGTPELIFGQGGGAWLEAKFQVPVLAQLPLMPGLREASDAGKPLPVYAPADPIAITFRDLAHKVLQRLENRVAAPPVPQIIN